MSDHPSPCSSADSIPASVDGYEASARQGQRTFDNYNNPSPSSGSMNTPPPSERNERRRYQFYVPTDGDRGRRDSSEQQRRGGDPPEITVPHGPPTTQGEEAAQKVRSRLIRLQNHHRDLRDNRGYNLRRPSNDVNPSISGNNSMGNSEMDGSERRSQSQILADEYDASIPSPHKSTTQESFDEEDREEDDDNFPSVNIDPIESDEDEPRNYYGSVPNSPIFGLNDDYRNCPNSEPLNSDRKGGKQQSLRHRMGNGVGDMMAGGNFKPPFATNDDFGGTAVPPFVREQQMQQQKQQALFYSNSGSADGNSKLFHGTDLNDSMSMMHNLKIGVDPHHSPTQQVVRAPRPSPSPKTPQDGEDYTINGYEVPQRPSPRKGSQNLTDNIKKGRFLTAQEAMNYVKSASNRAPPTNGASINQAVDDINRAYSFLNNMSSEDIAEYGLTGNRVQPVGKIMASFESENNEHSSCLEEDDDDDDFERNTSLSMHAEDKLGTIVPSNDDEISISMLEREGKDVVQHGIATSRLVDNHASDSHLYHRSRKESTNMHSPTSDHLTSSSIWEKNIVNQNLYAVEANGRSTEMYPASTSFDTGFSRRKSSEYDSKPPFHSHAALGPRNKKPGGVTGVNLGEYTKPNQQYHENESYDSDSPSNHSHSDDENSITDDAAYSSPRELVGEVDAQSTGLMSLLCGHLLPFGMDHSVQYGDDFSGMTSILAHNYQHQKPAWNDDDPDEPGYIVHRLTNAELNAVEYAFEKMIAAYGETGSNNNFERDLEEAEMILDEEEKRYKAKMDGMLHPPSEHSFEPETDSNDIADNIHHHTSSKSRGLHKETVSRDENEIRECVPDFPGIYPPGKGRTGELECFYLPIITKSQKTGFEPTKDLVLKSGTVFANNYLVQGELGSAAFSTAYRCIDLSSEEDEDGYQDEVCLKVIKNTKDYFDQSIDEIKILRLLKDTGKVQENNIIEMKSFFYHREHLVIVTELLRQNMYEFSKSIIESRGPAYFTRDRLSHIIRQCLIALKFVHELGLMHCDIKPENILLKSYSRALVKVIDFGSSSFVSDRQSSYIQSRSYRAPEVILGLPYDGGIDMWSLGCVVAEMYTGEVTFQNDSEVSMLSRIEAIRGPFPKHMIAKGRNSHRIFTDSGLIYEKVSQEEDDTISNSASSANDQVRIYQPKMTTMAARLGFEYDFMERQRVSEDDKMRALFIDFVSKLLTIDPDVRLTAEQALKHPWILSSLELTEDEIRYPPSD